MNKYERFDNCIKIYDTSSFNPEHILECGQVFCYDKISDDEYVVYPGDKYAKITKTDFGYLIQTDYPDYFIKWFDLAEDYERIKNKLGEFEILKEPIKFGYGIRILNQDLFETLISFVVSANNNIKRIKLILNSMREKLGQKTKYGYSFPSFNELLKQDEEFFKSIGAGYRAGQIYKLLRQIDEKMLKEWAELDTLSLRQKLISLSGVGPKVADCVLLFGYHRMNVFPVDTWIEQMYNQNYPQLTNRIKIRENLVSIFGDLSGQAQQYLFYFQRSFIR